MLIRAIELIVQLHSSPISVWTIIIAAVIASGLGSYFGVGVMAVLIVGSDDK
jgi:hypothetical protein